LGYTVPQYSITRIIYKCSMHCIINIQPSASNIELSVTGFDLAITLVNKYEKDILKTFPLSYCPFDSISSQILKIFQVFKLLTLLICELPNHHENP
jgi:hypothetical protein